MTTPHPSKPAFRIDYSKLTPEDSKRIGNIVSRFSKYIAHPTSTSMDLIACHTHANPLDLAAMEKGDEFDVMHDIAGIARHLNRGTGELGGCFIPRFTLAERGA